MSVSLASRPVLLCQSGFEGFVLLPWLFIAGGRVGEKAVTFWATVVSPTHWSKDTFSLILPHGREHGLHEGDLGVTFNVPSYTSKAADF